MRRVISLLCLDCLLGLLFVLMVGGGFASAHPALVNAPPATDSQCRGCHGDNQRSITLTSGELLPLLVELPMLDTSAHGITNTNGVGCRDCHRNASNYRFPHAPMTAPDRHAYRQSAAQQCQQCHTPHNPFHESPPGQAPDPKAPTCVDCHGSHQVARVAALAQTMPTQCVACHTDQTRTWASDLLAPRPGLGAGDPAYAGSTRCLACHTEIYQNWRQTWHAKTVQSVAANPSAALADFNHNDSALPFALAQVAYTLGGQWKQQYLTQTVSGTLSVLPGQWQVADHAWAAYQPPASQVADWRQSCSGCHVTGLVTATWSFTEFGVGCESCHGPSAKHIADPKQVKPYTQVDDQVCGACHSQGHAPDGLPFPATYRPGLRLTDHFTFTTSADHIWPDGRAKVNGQQYMDWQLGSAMAKAPNTSCTSCHQVHGGGHGPAQLKAPLNGLCVDCHEDKAALYTHTPYHQQASLKREFTCVDCHMPKTATSAVAFDIHNHSFLQPNPQGSLEHGGVALQPNACNQCHTRRDEGPSWAAQTIAYAKAQGVVGKKSLFIPGAFPTSPPPPTPLPSVGQAPAPYYVETGAWLRTVVYAVGGLLVLVMLILVYYWARQTRRSTHAGAD
jgi:predicted CXXCH cytochrome family protein